jgi:hypothetical protein
VQADTLVVCQDGVLLAMQALQQAMDNPDFRDFADKVQTAVRQSIHWAYGRHEVHHKSRALGIGLNPIVRLFLTVQQHCLRHFSGLLCICTVLSVAPGCAVICTLICCVCLLYADAACYEADSVP